MVVNRLPFTKLDETTQPGSLYQIPLTTGLPVSFVATGQRIPDDLFDCTPERLTRWIWGANS